MIKYKNPLKAGKNEKRNLKLFKVITLMSLVAPTAAHAGAEVNSGNVGDTDATTTLDTSSEDRETTSLPNVISANGGKKFTPSEYRKFWREVVLGGASGVFEVTVNQPIVYAKNCVQQDKQVMWRLPSVWYRGYCVNAGSMGPITALQMGTNALLTAALAKEDAELTADKKIFAGFLAGAISSLVSSPAELGSYSS